MALATANFAFRAAIRSTVVALLLASTASASVSRTETSTLLGTYALQVFVVEDSTGGDAQAIRAQANTDGDTEVSAQEAQAFEVNASAERVGAGATYLRWDALAPVWTNLTVAAVGLQGSAVGGSTISVTVDGVLALSSLPGDNHTLTFNRPPGYANWDVTLNLPSGWSFGNFTGVTNANQTNNSLTASLNEGVAVFELRAPPTLPGTVSRDETFTVVSPAVLEYYVVENYTGGDAQAERFKADADSSGAVTPSEVAVYEAQATAARMGYPARFTKWDGEPPLWTSVSVNAQGLEGAVASDLPVAVTFDGTLDTFSATGVNHTLSISRPPEYDSWQVTLHLPANWGFGNVTGNLTVNQSAGAITVLLSPGVTVFSVTSPASGGGLPTAPSAGNSSLLLLAGAGALAAGALGVVALRRRAPRTGAPAAPRPPPYVLEGFLLLYKDGRLLYHQTSGAEGRLEDPEVVGSMFTAITEFVRESLRNESPLSRLTYGQNTILLDRSPHLFGAVIVYGEPDDELRDGLHEALVRMESAYTGVVERWSGDRAAFAGAAAFVAPLFARTKGLTRAQIHAAVLEKTVKLLSETEHFRGYIRLKVAVTNDTAAPVHDAVVTVEFNEEVLRLARVDPVVFHRSGRSVHMGEVKPGERMCVNYLLDPQTCNQTNIDGRVTYRDPSGTAHHVSMKTRHAEIVCPIFFTPEQANAATLQRLIHSSLPVRDARSYRIKSLPKGATYSELYAIARDAVQRHDIRLVRNLTKPPPFEGKAWFFGKTKVGASDVIVRASAAEQKQTVEFYVATDSAASLTGLLAELNHSFDEILKKRMPGASVEPVFEETFEPLAPAPPLDAATGQGTDAGPLGPLT